MNVAAGILVMDLLWATGLLGLGWLSASVLLAVMHAMPGAPGLALGVAAAILTWILACVVLLAVLPKPRPGTYRLLRGRDFYMWVFAFIVRRWIDLPPMGLLYRQSGVLRFLVLRAAGAKLAFTAQMSSDADVLDPALLTMGAGAMLGSRVTVAGHFIVGDRLVLAPVVLHPGAQIAIDVIIAPGVTIGRNALVEGRSNVGPDVVIGDDAVIGIGVTLGRAVIVGQRARIRVASVVPARTQIPDDGRWPPDAAPDAPLPPASPSPAAPPPVTSSPSPMPPST